MFLISVWIEHPVRALDRTYTYWYEEELQQGVRVEIVFNGRRLIGFVESSVFYDGDASMASAEAGMAIRHIDGVLDASPLITPELHDLALYMHDATLSSTISCFQAMLPSRVKPSSHRGTVVMEKTVRLSDEEVRLTPKELEAWEYVRANGTVLYSDLRRQWPNQAHSLVVKGAVLVEEREREAAAHKLLLNQSPHTLNEEQQRAVQEIHAGKETVYLVHGVTGSGKTEVYLRLAEEVIRSGKQVLFLVPEIGLTPLMISRVTQRFGEDLAIYHSALNPQEKYEQYRKVMNGRTSIVVGTRSAAFLPFTDLGLIVMDEEHDASYKQDVQPAYHCRDIAVWRAQYHHCKVILGSATPSLESYARAYKGIYRLIVLHERINRTQPLMRTVNMRDEKQHKRSALLSDALIDGIQDRLDSNKQIIILLNRRGYHSVMKCRECGEALICPHCDVAMSYHRTENVMKCHTCGYTARVPRVCPHCGSTAGFTTYGFGTERLEQEINHFFPQARVLRMDADTTSAKNSHARILERFGRHDADILLGTQMIAKGLDYPDVTLVGVINADEGLMRTDYRSCEMTFDLLMQAGGRSGRAEDAGEVIYQVFAPDHYAVQCVLAQDYEKFFAYEMQFRHAGQYPPYTYFISLTISAKSEKETERSMDVLQKLLGEQLKTIGPLDLPKVQDRYRSRLLVKGKDLESMRSVLRSVLFSDECINMNVRVNVEPLALEQV